MWQYSQKSGNLEFSGSPVVGAVATGYSGAGTLKNNPDMQCVSDLGPIPRGEYEIGDPLDLNVDGHTISYALPLRPQAGTDTCNRTGFYIHGDSRTFPGSASAGCIILPLDVRKKIAESNDKVLRVVSG